MSEPASTLRKLDQNTWELRLVVETKYTELAPLQWVWTAGVSIEDNPENTLAITYAESTPVGMPDGGDRGESSYATGLTGG